MKISAKAEYACLAILELARHFKSESPLRMKQIAARRRIPESFLVQILLKLRRSGIVSTVRGSIGGYRLVPNPDELTLGFIIGLMDDSDATAEKSRRTDGSKISRRESEIASREPKVSRRRPKSDSSSNDDSKDSDDQLLTRLFEQAEQKRQEFLNSITFQELLNFSEFDPSAEND